MFSLPLDLRFLILAHLNKKDLKNFTICSKNCHGLTINDKFWTRKLLIDYPEYLPKKPLYYNSKQWYQKIADSGDLYYYASIQDENARFQASDVYKAWMGYGCTMYIDIYDRLHCLTNGVFIKNLKHLPRDSQKFRIASIVCGNQYILVLTCDSILYEVRGSEWKKLADNVDTLMGNWKEQCWITHDRNLFWYTTEPILIAQNVVQAAIDGNSEQRNQRIYYVDTKGQLWLHRQIVGSQVFTLDKPQYITSHPFTKKEFTKELLVRGGVKSVASISGVMAVVDEESKLWIYSNSLFEPTARDLNMKLQHCYENYKIQKLGPASNYSFLLLDDKHEAYHIYACHFNQRVLYSKFSNVLNIFPIEPEGDDEAPGFYFTTIRTSNPSKTLHQNEDEEEEEEEDEEDD